MALLINANDGNCRNETHKTRLNIGKEVNVHFEGFCWALVEGSFEHREIVPVVIIKICCCLQISSLEVEKMHESQARAKGHEKGSS